MSAIAGNGEAGVAHAYLGHAVRAAGMEVFMVIDEMVRTLSQYPNGTFLRLSWDCESFVIDGILDTIYETDNGADEGSKEYQEFYACAIQIKHIIKSSENRTLALNSLIEISINNQPTRIELSNGKVIWPIYSSPNDAPLQTSTH